jgi:hypothetical protein
MLQVVSEQQVEQLAERALPVVLVYLLLEQQSSVAVYSDRLR